MKKKNIFTKTLAVVGTVLTWFPILAPVFLSISAFISARIFRFDYLMPAELFLFGLVGGGLLLWAALWARSQYKVIGWGLGLAIAFLVGGQALAVATGLTSGATKPDGWQWILVLGLLILYTLALVGIGIGGILLLRQLFKKTGG